MAIYKIKLDDDSLFEYESYDSFEQAIAEIRDMDQFINCQDYRGKSYYVNKNSIRMIYPEND